MNLLLVENDPLLQKSMVELMEKAGYRVDAAGDGETAMAMAFTGVHDLMVVCRRMPDLDGLVLLEEVRRAGIGTPVMFIDGTDSPYDRVAGLQAGADDYLVRPFLKEELLARLGSLTRRQGKGVAGQLRKAAGLILDPLRCEVRVGETIIQLSVKESALLELLMLNEGQVVTRETIMGKIWGYQSDSDVAIIDVYIHYLRKKLPLTTMIRTVRGVGYCLREICLPDAVSVSPAAREPMHIRGDLRGGEWSWIGLSQVGGFVK